MKKYIMAVFTFLFLFCLNVPGAVAAPYYERKVVKIVVGNSPGGGYDRMARLVAKHLPKHIPGKPSVIIENMVGAGGIVAANYVYQIAKPDGLTLGTFNAAIPFAQLTKQAGVKFDVLKFAWVGSTAVEGTVFALRTDLPYKTAAELLKAKPPLMVGATGITDVSGVFSVMLREYVGLNIKMIYYPSSAEVMLAVERKEVDGRAGSYSALKPFIDRGLVRPLIRGRVPEKGTEQLPVNSDLATSKIGKAVMQMLSASEFIGRPFVCPPGTPPAQMKILSDGFAKLAGDPQMMEDARRASMEIQYTPGKDIMKVLDSIFSQPKDVVAEFSKYVSL
jgi:tripartite-type tricarboxylate transporter receptor subunit TctC